MSHVDRLFELNRYGRGRFAALDSDFTDPNAPRHYPPDLELEPTHLEIDLHVDLAAQTAVGTVTTTVVARGAQPSVLTLDAVDFEVLAVADPDGNGLSWRYDGRQLIIHWDEPFTTGETRRAAVSYRVVQPADGLHFSRPNDAYPDAPWYAATDHETERARHWLPCIDQPNVRTTLNFRLRAAARFTILANGYLVDETAHDDETKTAHWRLEQLCPSYLVCFAIGDFVRADDGVFTDGEQAVPLAYFCSRAHTAADLQRTFGRTRPMLEWMTRKLAMPFPYPKYYQFALPGIGGAMENISLVSWDDRSVQDETLAQEYGWWIDLVNVHEMAHSYFGDAIVCRDFAHAWLKESWATYIEQCWLEDEDSRDNRDYLYFTDARAYFEEADDDYQRPIVTRRFKSSWQMYDAHLYPGGACRLHTLRQELGDEVFWTAVRDYLQRYNGKVVETDHFRHVMEEHSGRSLGQFFDQWFFTAGYPDLKVAFEYDDKRKRGVFEVEQKQVDKAKNVPAFVLNTHLGWTLDGRAYTLPIKLENEKHTFVVDMPSKPEQARFDPHHVVLHKLAFNPGDALLRRQLTDAPDVIGRILAAQELVKSGKRGNIQAVVDAYAAEAHWGVRREMARALGEANSATAVAGLVELVAYEQDPMVMATVFSAAGKFRDARLRDTLVARLEGGLPYLATQTIYESLGEQRQRAPLELLLQAARRDSFNGFVQMGALRGLGHSRQEGALDSLLTAVPYGAVSNHARPAAVQALADIGRGQEKARREQIVEALTDLLRDPWPPVQFAAARGLRTMRAPEAIAALEAHARGLSRQREVFVEKLISALRDEDKLDGSALKKQVEELRETIRKLQDRLETLEAKVEPEEGNENTD